MQSGRSGACMASYKVGQILHTRYDRFFIKPWHIFHDKTDFSFKPWHILPFCIKVGRQVVEYQHGQSIWGGHSHLLHGQQVINTTFLCTVGHSFMGGRV